MTTMLPPGTRFLTDDELAARRRRQSSRPATTRRSAPARAARAVRRELPPLSLSPRRQVKHIADHPGSSVLFLFFLLIVVDAIRRGGLQSFTLERSLGYAVAAIGVMVIASFAPGFARVLVGGTLVIAAIQAAPQIAEFFRSATSTISSARPGSRPLVE